VAAGFKIRRISSNQSIGDKLKRSRTRKKIDVAQAEESTKIRAKFILALESDSWEQIPSEVYGRGFLERYSEYLGLSVPEIMAQYDRERHAYARSCREPHVEFSPKNTVRMPRFFLTPRVTLAGIVTLCLLGFVGVIGYQLVRFSQAPFLDLATPVQAAGATPNVKVAGKTTVNAVVTVDGRQASVGQDGSFVQSVPVEKGMNVVTVEASNGKKATSETLSVVAS
jgi:cytoskeletal protein RodZ